MLLPLSQPIREAIGKKTFSNLDRSRTAEWLVFAMTACHVQMKGKAYSKFSLPPNKKATAGKARALRLGGGARNPPKRPQRRLSKTNQSISSVTCACLALCMQMTIRPVRLSGFVRPPAPLKVHQNRPQQLLVNGNRVGVSPTSSKKGLCDLLGFQLY